MAQDHAVPETPDIVIGNTTLKYAAKNPAIRFLTERWLANLARVVDQVAADPRGEPKRVLEVGCGEGVIADRLRRRFPEVAALDLPDAGLRSWWRDNHAGPSYLHADAHHLPFEDGEFDLVVSVEVLEHLADPERGLREMARVSSRHMIFSVPREPVFRGCNLLAGRYVSDLGNTPGHLNHWSKRSFTRFVGTVADVRGVTAPFPWTTVWASH
ncbi:MAG TPA: class I SAM-dependent methyltransferase [Streptosporangiaceae bacterium]